MLYLEDYLEMIEHLPSELRDRFTELREMDLSVQNRVDSLDERQKVFFENCNGLNSAEKDEEYKQIKKEYGKVIEDASEKIQISEDCYGLVDRYFRKLDQELHKFKMELEADNRGITEILEKKSLELDLPATNSFKENRHPKKTKKHPGENRLFAHHKQAMLETLSLDSFSSGSQSSTSASLAATLHQMFPLQHMGAGGPSNAIAVAASQAIAATQQLTGRRTSSLKASFEAVNNLGFPANDFSLNRDLASAAATANFATALGFQGSDASLGPPPSKKKKSSSSRPSATITTASAASTNPGTPLLDVDSIFNPDFGISPSTSDLFSMNPTETEPDQLWPEDPNEPRYCTCNQVSYGDMVACDNQDCPFEWFHYPCVGITSTPKGKWYCSSCQASMTRRKGRK